MFPSSSGGIWSATIPRAMVLQLVAVCWACLAQEPSAQSSVFATLCQKVQKAEPDTGCPPDPFEVTRLIYEARAGLSQDQRQEVWRAWMQAQRPEMSKAELTRLAQRRRQAIGALNCRYTIRRFDDPSKQLGSAMARYEEVWFVMAGSKARLERAEGVGPNALEGLRVLAYDGECLRRVRDEWEDPPYGTIEEFRSRAVFFSGRTGLMHGLMLLDADTEMSVKFAAFSLVEFLRHEATRVVQGTRRVGDRPAVLCVLGTPPSYAVWLDVERGCAVLRFVGFHIVPDGGALRIDPRSVRSAEDFKDYGNGVWLPNRITTYDVPLGVGLDQPDRFVRREELRIQECAVNQPVEDAVFRDIFSPGTTVSDTLSETVYTRDDLPDIVPGFPPVADMTLPQADLEPTEPKETVGDVPAPPQQDAASADPNRTEGDGIQDSGTRWQWLIPAVVAGVASLVLFCAGTYLWRRRTNARGGA